MLRWISGLALLLLLRADVSFGQAGGASHPNFEAASIRSYDPASPANFFTMVGGPGTSDPSRFMCRKCTLVNLLMTAFDIKGYQLSIVRRTERYDVEAKIPEETSRAQFLQMLQNLLVQRFRLSYHHEMKDMTTYHLVVGKNALKLTQSVVVGSLPDNNPATAPHKEDKNGFPDLPPGSGINVYADAHNTYRLGARNTSIARLADALSGFLSRPVLDMTGLQGEYDFKLLWAPDLAPVVRHQDGTIVQSGPDDDSRPTLQQALQKQLGLILESSHGPVDVLIIDRAEQVPLEN